MNKLLLPIILLCATCCLSSAQSVEEAFAGKKDCVEIDLIALEVIPKFYNAGQLDSIELVLDYVSIMCAETASLRLARILLLIEQHRFSDTLFTPLTIHYIKKESQALGKGHLYDFAQFQHMSRFYMGSSAYGSILGRQGQIEAAYVQMMHDWATRLAMRTGNDPLEEAIINHMQPAESSNRTGRTLWSVASSMPAHSALPTAYNRYHADFVLFRSWQFTGAAGTWQPLGDLRAAMGPRTLLTFTIGKNMGGGRSRIDFGGSFPLGTMPAPFTVVRPDTTFTSNESYFSYMHLDYVHTLVRPNRYIEWNVNLGVSLAEKAVHDFASEGVGEDNPREEAILDKMGNWHAYGFGPNAGTEFKLFLASGVALNLQARYHMVGVSRLKGTSFSGSSVQLAAGLTVHFGGHAARTAGSDNLIW